MKRTTTGIIEQNKANLPAEAHSDVMIESSKCTLEGVGFNERPSDEVQELNAARILGDLTYGVVNHDEVSVPDYDHMNDRTMRVRGKEWMRSFEKKVLLWAMRKLGYLFSFNDVYGDKATKLMVLANVSQTHLETIPQFEKLIAKAKWERNQAFNNLVNLEVNAEIETWHLDHDEHDTLLLEYPSDRYREDDNNARNKLNEQLLAIEHLKEIKNMGTDEDSFNTLFGQLYSNAFEIVRKHLEVMFNRCGDITEEYLNDRHTGYKHSEALKDYIAKREYAITLQITRDEHRFGLRSPDFFQMSMLGRLATKQYLGVKFDKADVEFLATVKDNPMYERIIAATENVDKS